MSVHRHIMWCLFACTSVWRNSHSTSLNHNGTSAWYIHQLAVDRKVSKICGSLCGHIAACRRPTSSTAWCRRRVVSVSCTFQRAIVAALRVADNGSYHFHCMILADFCGAGVCLCLFLLLDIVYLAICANLGLVVGMTKQMSNCKEVDIVNS